MNYTMKETLKNTSEISFKFKAQINIKIHTSYVQFCASLDTYQIKLLALFKYPFATYDTDINLTRNN